MVGPKTLIFIQIVLDFLFFMVSLFTYFNMIFKYMKDYNLGVIQISYEINNNSNLTEYVIGFYDQFNTYFCEEQPNLKGMQEICNNLENFKAAGITYLSISCVAHLFLIYGMINVIAKIFKPKSGFLLFEYPRLICLGVYSVSVACYLGITQIFTLTPPSGSSQNSSVGVNIGIFSLFLSELLIIVSTIFYFVMRKKINIGLVDSSKNIDDRTGKKNKSKVKPSL